MTEIVVVGAGYAGLTAAKRLEEILYEKGNISGTRITLINKQPYHTLLTEVHEVVSGRMSKDAVKVELNQLFVGSKINTVMDTVTEVLFEEKKVLGKKREYPYDYLVLAAGSRPTYFGVEGAEEYCYTLWSLEDAVMLRKRIYHCFSQAAEEKNGERRRELLSFYLIGAGFTGIELVGELVDAVKILCRKFQIKREEVTIVNVDGLSRPVPNLPEKLSNKVTHYLQKQRVRLLMNTSVVGVGENFIKLKHDDEVTLHTAGTVIWTAGIQSAEITSLAAKEIPNEGRGRIIVDSYLRSPMHENVYVVGDNVMYTAPGEKTPVPQMVENAEQSAETAAKNIATLITQKGELEEYRPEFHGMIISVGRHYGVASMPMGKCQRNFGPFMSVILKHFVQLNYLAQLLGWKRAIRHRRK